MEGTREEGVKQHWQVGMDVQQEKEHIWRRAVRGAGTNGSAKEQEGRKPGNRSICICWNAATLLAATLPSDGTEKVPGRRASNDHGRDMWYRWAKSE